MIFKIINFTGLLAGVSLLITFVTGIFHVFPLHIIFGFITATLGFTHFGIILYKNWKIKKRLPIS